MSYLCTVKEGVQLKQKINKKKIYFLSQVQEIGHLELTNFFDK